MRERRNRERRRRVGEALREVRRLGSVDLTVSRGRGCWSLRWRWSTPLGARKLFRRGSRSAFDPLLLGQRKRQSLERTMQNLLLEVDRRGVDNGLAVALCSLCCSRLLLVAANLLGLKRRLVRLENSVGSGVAIVDVEVVVVRSRKDMPAKRRLASALTLRRRRGKAKTHSPSPEKVHSNLSKMQSFSYRSQSLVLRWS